MKKLHKLVLASCLASSMVTVACGAGVETASQQTPQTETPATPPATTQTSAPPAQTTAATEPASQPAKPKLPNSIVYTIDGMENVQVKENQTYKTLPDGDDLMLDVYLPEDAVKEKTYPTVIIVHGRGRNPVNLKSRGQYITWGQLIAKSGMAAVTFNYRLSTFDRTAESYEDIKDLVSYVRQHADSLQIDKDRMAIITYSASGAAGLYMPLKERPPFIKAMVSYYNWLDLEHMREFTEPADFDKLNEFAPITQLQREPQKIAPMLVVKAGKDSEQINTSIDNFMKTAKEKQANVQLLEHPDGDHGFDFENDNDTSREIIKQTVEFLKEHLLEK
ncbi:prolyl oligopeptidase family serine peptidase [Brevibacillus ruminantium]|uniref:Prolyl oligopeptidase family serine peptidase n=1 Tax=Brevibacillus ruminantium TaxID=2950604 RepID=A0ABY4WEY9_9BACL|nr:alpha/beta hydrolase fold domain-containing protein [Brevibacillus ruminantium]USG65697.1 prolyl oligopeptidase family serine peptidase [Brevibacillus ruminantium]